MENIYTYKAREAEENSVSSCEQMHTLAPKSQERILLKIKESSEILQHINFVPVIDLESAEGTLVAAGPFSSRTSKENLPRLCKSLIVDPKPYKCVQTNLDVSIRYSTIDAWTRLGGLHDRIDQALAEQTGLDQIMIGFNGTQAAEQTNRTTNPLLQDVNIGWLQKIRANAPEQIIDGAEIGPGSQYSSLDALAYAALQRLSAPCRKLPELVVLIDRETLNSKHALHLEQTGDLAGQLALQRILSSRELAGLPIFDAPFMPGGTMLITSLDNLSILYQEGAARQFIKDDVGSNAICFYRQRNEAYIVEDYDRCALVEGIEFAQPEPEGQQDEG